MASVVAGERLEFLQLSPDTVREVISEHPSPGLTLGMPTHRNVPDNRVDRPTYRHLVEALEAALLPICSRAETGRLLEPLRALGETVRFWEHTREGLVVLAADGKARVFVLPVPVHPVAVVGPQFHTLPLVRLAASSDRYNVLCLTSREARLYEGCLVDGAPDSLDVVSLHGPEGPPGLSRAEVVDAEIHQPHRVFRGMGPAGLGAGSVVHGGTGSKQDDIDADTEIFFRHVDDVVREQVALRSRLPLVIVALPRLAAVFRRLSKNRHLLDEFVPHDAHLLPPDRLPELVAPLFARARERRIEHALHRFSVARDRGLAAGDIPDIARAAAAGNVALLILERERDEPPAHGESPLGVLVDTVILQGGEILPVERIRMPTESGAAAIYRYA